MPEPQPDDLQRHRLLTLRVIWAALLLGQITLAAATIWTIQGRSSAVHSMLPREIADMLFYINLFMLLILVPTGYSVRNQIYKRNWVAQSITPDGYLIGNLVVFAICEAIAIKGVAVCFLTGILWPILIPAIGAMAVLAINFPTGRAMDPFPKHS